MKKAGYVLIPITAAALLAGCSVDPETRFARAQENVAEHDYATARIELLAALDDKPGDTAMLSLLAESLIALGDGEGALAALNKIDGTAADDPDYKLTMGEAQLLRGQPEKAAAVVEGLSSAGASRIRALAHIATGEAGSAIKEFEKALSAEGPKAPVYAAYALLALQLGDMPKAAELTKAAKTADPHLLETITTSAQLALSGNNLPEALAEYDRALSIYPGNLSARVGKIGVLGDMGRFEEAEELLQQTLKTDPGNFQLLFLRVRLASEKGQWQEIRTMLQSREDLVRKDPRLRALYGQALLRLGQSQQARSWLEPLLSRYPGHRSARLWLAEAQIAGGDPEAALDRVRPIVERPDATPEELSLAAEAARQVGDTKAVEYAQRAKLPAPEWVGGELAKADKALRNQQWVSAMEGYGAIMARTNKPNALVLNNYAYATAQSGDQQTALRLAEQALQLAPKHPSIMDTTGWLLVRTGKDSSRGLALLKEASRLDPDNATIAKHLAAASR